MKKIFYILIFLIICTSSSYCENISEGNNLNIIIDSKKISASPIVSAILYKNTSHLSQKIIRDFFNYYIYYDNNTQTIFIKELEEYKRIESFFQKVQNRLYLINSVQIDIINEIKNTTTSYSFGNSIYMDKKTNTVLQKNILDNNWKESNMKINHTITNFNSNFFAGLSFDRAKSSDNQIVFHGFYPTNSGTLCNATIYVDTATLLITKQVSEFYNKDMLIKQNVLYRYE